MNSGNTTSSSSAECDSRSALTLINNHHQQQSTPFNDYHMTTMIDHQNQMMMINNVDVVNPFLFSSSSQQHQLLNLDPIINWSKTLPAAAFSDHQPATARNTVPFSEVLNTPSSTTNPSPPPPPPAARKSKKRSRASRKPPTTVLTTNTNNFRAMVQEFTGIPAPPFTSTSFDLFGRPSTQMMRSNNFDNLPQQPSYSYLLPQKLQSSSSSSSSFCYLPINTMQNPSNSLDQSPFLNPKTTENHVWFDGIRQTQIKDHRTTLHDLVTFQKTQPEK